MYDSEKSRPCHVIEFIGLPGVGKTTLARAIVNSSEMTHSGRPRLRGEKRPGDISVLLISALVHPFASFGILAVGVLTAVVAVGTLSQRWARTARMLTGLFEMLNAAHRGQRLIMDEGPLVWLAAIHWRSMFIAKLIIKILGWLYCSFFNCSLVYLAGSSHVIMQRRNKRTKENKVPSSKAGPNYKREHPKKRNDLERIQALRFLWLVMERFGVRKIKMDVAESDSVNPIVLVAGWC